MDANNFVPAALKELAKLYEERNATYGDSYHKFGEVLEIVFPDGLFLKTASDFNRFIAYFNCMGKLVRYAPNFTKGGHVDSLDDTSVYAQMLQQLDFEFNIEKGKEND
jgi:hypothetical protein